MRVEGPRGGALRGGAGRGGGLKEDRSAQARAGWDCCARPKVFASWLPPRWGARGSLVLSARLDRPRDSRPTASGTEAGRMGRQCAGLGLPWPDHSQTRSSEYGVLRAPSILPELSKPLYLRTSVSASGSPLLQNPQIGLDGKLHSPGGPPGPPGSSSHLYIHTPSPDDSRVILLVPQLSSIGCFLKHNTFF